MKNTKKIASGAVVVAVCTIIMLPGAVLELEMYAAPLLAGLCLITYDQRYGLKYHPVAFV